MSERASDPMTMTPRPDPLAFLEDEVAALRERHLYRALRVMSSAQGPIVTHRFHYTEFEKGFEAMMSGCSGKVILNWE